MERGEVRTIQRFDVANGSLEALENRVVVPWLIGTWGGAWRSGLPLADVSQSAVDSRPSEPFSDLNVALRSSAFRLT